MGIISSYADDPTTTDSDRFLTYASDGSTKLTPASNLKPYLGFTTDPSGSWASLANAPNSVAYLGNRSYQLTFNAVNLTTSLSNGMRLRTTRTVAAPTQCTSLNGTTQAWSKTTPAGMTFTGDFTASGWIKLTSYPTVSVGIISRSNTTAGWLMYINSAGQLGVGYGTASNIRFIEAYQSVQLNKWVHVATVPSISGGTAVLYMDGVVVANKGTVSGTATTMTQAGNLEVGTFNGSGFFPGKIAQASIFSAALSQATIQSYISQGLVGTETSLVSAYAFNGNGNDLSANANHLTAVGAATATNADSAFGGQAGGTISSTLDYAIITSSSFSTNTTITVQVPEGCTIPTSGGVAGLSYTSSKAPYGMPIQEDKWSIVFQDLTTSVVATPAANTWYNGSTTNLSTSIPIGAWKITYGGMLEVNYPVSVTNVLFASLSTAPNASGGLDTLLATIACTTAAAPTFGSTSYTTIHRTYAVATTVYLNLSVSTTPTNIYLNGGAAPTLISASLEYL